MSKHPYPSGRCEHEDYNDFAEFGPEPPEIPEAYQRCWFCEYCDRNSPPRRVRACDGEDLVCHPCLAVSWRLVETDAPARGCPCFLPGAAALRAAQELQESKNAV